jgi:hypothetical protein
MKICRSKIGSQYCIRIEQTGNNFRKKRDEAETSSFNVH